MLNHEKVLPTAHRVIATGFFSHKTGPKKSAKPAQARLVQKDKKSQPFLMVSQHIPHV